MLNFHKVCERLRNAVSVEGAPNCEVMPAIVFDAENNNMHGKLQFVFNTWLQLDHTNAVYTLTPAGRCKIDNFTGNQLLRIFCNFVWNREEINKPGKYLEFLVNDEVRLIILFVKDRAIPITPPDCDREKRLFQKLFHDEFVEKEKSGFYPEEYVDDAIRQIRKKASEEYPKFLSTKLAECSSLTCQYAFLGLLVDLAVRMDEQEPYRGTNTLVQHIPFPAGVKIAFDLEMSGLVWKLFGQREHLTRNVYEQRAQTCVDAFKYILQR